MAAAAWLRSALYAYSLPKELLEDLIGKDSAYVGSQPADEPSESDGESNTRGATSCALCGTAYDGNTTQKAHIRSEFHRYNLKLKIRHQKPVSEAEFEKLVEDIDESISGSESSTEEDEDDEKDDMLTSLLKKNMSLSNEPSASSKKKGTGSPYFWFGSPKLEQNTSLGIFKSLFSVEEQDDFDSLVESVQRKQLTYDGPESVDAADRHFFLCMNGGGHFAAMLVGLKPKKTKQANASERELEILAHKTFHRYTTRRKQGGAQSTKDAKGKAHSAGATLRRYNESALRDEVRELLDDWREMIDTAELIFVRATGAHNRRTLFGPYDGQVLSTRDRRLRGFPFNTKRATQNELVRAFNKLTTVQISHIDHAAIAAAAAAAAAAKEEREIQAALEKARSSASTPVKPTKEELEAENHTMQIIAHINRSKAPALLSYLQNNPSINPSTFLFQPASKHHHAPTMLHLAASKNSIPIINTLLLKAGVDPTVRNEQGKTAYELCGTRATRDAFRVARHELGEEKWNWAESGVGEAMTRETLLEREAAEKAEGEREAQKRRDELEAERKKLEAEESPATNGKASRSLLGSASRILGGGKKQDPNGGRLLGSSNDIQGRADAERGLTDEMKKRLEREKRARAMEERLKRMQGGGGSAA